MSKSLRRSEKWFRRALWLVAVIFAMFLISLGGLIVSDLPLVEPYHSLDDYMDEAQTKALNAQITQLETETEGIQPQIHQAELSLETLNTLIEAKRTSLKEWVSTREATERSDQDKELIDRNHELDRLSKEQTTARKQLSDLQESQRKSYEALDKVHTQLQKLRDEAYDVMAVDTRRAETRIFFYRLTIALPLLLLAAWLFVKKRKGKWWPFVWGFIFFAFFLFFVELVPYLPDYGGYIRLSVGIIVTIFAGRYAIIALNRYLEQQRTVEAEPDEVRRQKMSYDLALTRLDKGVCPSCERFVDLKDDKIDFCPHCGIGLFNHCPRCHSRKSSFSKFCFSCGLSANHTPTQESESGALALTRIDPSQGSEV